MAPSYSCPESNFIFNDLAGSVTNICGGEVALEVKCRLQSFLKGTLLSWILLK